MMKEIKDNIENAENLPESMVAEQGAAAQEREGSTATELGKFKSVDALLRAYNSLQAEFTRRSQRLKELEKDVAQNTPSPEAEPVTLSDGKNASASSPLPQSRPDDIEQTLYTQANGSRKVREKIINDYLEEVKKSAVPLMGSGVSVVSPALKAKNIVDAGRMALGYFQNNHH